MLSNDETGLFMPVEISSDSLIVLKFFRDGMKPGIIPAKVIGERKNKDPHYKLGRARLFQ